MRRVLAIAVLIGLAAAGSAPAQTQADRRERKEPGLILETPGRMASCDALTFVREGDDLFLLAAGDDKVVIVWQVVGDRLVEKRRLRWGIYREQRGSIYALTTFRDGTKKLKVAVAGWGRQVGQVAVIDFESGRLDHVLPGDADNAFAVWSLAAAPDGDQLAWGAGDGTVWVWDIAAKRATALGGPLPSRAERKADNRVCFLAYTGDRRLISAAHDGRVLEWNTSRPEQKPRVRFAFDAEQFHGVERIALSPDRKWVAATGNSARVEIRSFPDGAKATVISGFAEGQLPESVAFDADARRLAVGVRVRDARSPYFYELNGHVLLYDLGGVRPAAAGRLPMTMFAEVMAFDPDGDRLAVAGGDNHEVTLWDVARRKELFTAASPGRSLWQVALSRDGRSLGVKDRRRERAPDSPNDRGAGDYHVFDLGLGAARRDWADGEGFRPVAPVERLDGWSVRFGDPFTWYAVDPDGRSHELLLSRAIDDLPRCYTFLKATDDKPIRLAVGHYWGVSLFEMDARRDSFARSRVYVGHQGYVTSVAPSADHRMLVTASRDQTVNCWSLADWPRQAELGVDFAVRGGKLIVKGADPGSPAWQAGLAEGAEVELLEAEELVQREFKNTPVGKDPAAWQKRFEAARAYGGFVFRYKNKGDKDWSLTLMTARQRPVWRFFPTFAAGAAGRSVPRDWVLWRWQDYVYDASTDGDRFVGWQVSGQVADQPVYHPAERLRGRFLNPAKVRATLGRAASDPERVQFREIEPPKATAKVAAAAVKDTPATATVSAAHVGEGELQDLARVEVWVNDRYLVKTFTAADFKGGDLPPADVTIAAGDMQVGANTIKVLAINKADGRGEAIARVRFDTAVRPVKPVLYGLFVGIGDYKKASQKTFSLVTLKADRDAEAVRDLWRRQQDTHLYERVESSVLLNDKATPAAILQRIEELSHVVRPDDQFVLFLAGHGYAEPVAAGPKGDKDPDRFTPGTFFLVGPNFDEDRLDRTTLQGEKLRTALAKLKCHQLVLIDACHAGGLGSNPLRDLRRNSVGAMVLAACKITQSAYEQTQKGHGYFMLALQEALGDGFKADRDGDGGLEPAELAEYVIDRVPRLLADDSPAFRGLQTPEVSPRLDELSAYHRRLAQKP